LSFFFNKGLNKSVSSFCNLYIIIVVVVVVVVVGGGWEFFSSLLRLDRLRGPPSLLTNGYQGALSLGVKRPKREADHSPKSSAEAKNAWSYTSTPQYASMTLCLFKVRVNFIYTFYYYYYYY
jgi:hypothetical protein